MTRKIYFVLVVLLYISTHSIEAQGIRFMMSRSEKYYPVFEFPFPGELEVLHPDATFEDLEEMRTSNWETFKSYCDFGKVGGDEVYLPAGRIELFKPQDDEITISSNEVLTVSGRGRDLTELVVYPFTPLSTNYVFNPQPGGSINLRNSKFSQSARKKYESYQCVLKKDSNLKKVELLGDVRPEFWDNLSVGKVAFYSWELATNGADNTIASWDEPTQTIFFTNNISGSVSNNMSGEYVWFGTYFEEQISIDDYETYGNFWASQNDGTVLIYYISGSTTGEELQVNLQNVVTENFDRHIVLSAPDKVTVNLSDVRTSYSQIGMNLFTQNENARSSVSGNNIEVDNCGYLIVGGRNTSTAGNILGSGWYLHPNVVVNVSQLNPHDNLAGAIRQYSSTGPKPVNPEDVSTFTDVTFSNNTEYDILLSNSMPTIINGITTGDIIVGHNTEINDAVINKGIYTTVQNVPESGFDYTIEVNNTLLNGVISLGWSETRQNRTTLNINDLTVPTTNTGDYKISSTTSYLKQLNLDGVTMHRQDPITVYVDGENRPTSPTYADGLISPANIAEININNLDTDRFWNSVLVLNSSLNNPLGHDLKIRITNSSLLNTTLIGIYPFTDRARYISDMIEMENTPYINDIGRRTITVAFAKVTPVSAVYPSTKSIDATLSMQDPSQGGVLATTSFSNVLQVDFSHDQYSVNSGEIKHIAPIVRNVNNSGVAQLMTMSASYNGDILVTAVGGPITFTQFDASTNTQGNLLNSLVLPSGQTARLIPDRKHLFTTSANSTSSSVLLGTGNGTNTVFSIAMAVRIVIPGTFSFVAGGVSGADDGNGNIIGSGISYGFIDYMAGSIYLEFDSPVGNGVEILGTYDVPNGLRNVGGWSVELD